MFGTRSEMNFCCQSFHCLDNPSDYLNRKNKLIKNNPNYNRGHMILSEVQPEFEKVMLISRTELLTGFIRYEYQTQNQLYTTTSYRNRDIRSRSRSRSPAFSTRLHMDESPAKHNVRSRISSRPSKKALSPITFTTPQRTASHASNASYYRGHTQEEMGGEFFRIILF